MIEPNNHSNAGFDHWARLARQDPELFERERARILEAAICSAPSRRQPRLRCLQWKLDRIRQTSSTPMVASLRMNRLLWEAVAGRDGLIARLGNLKTPGKPGRPPEESAEIRPFPG